MHALCLLLMSASKANDIKSDKVQAVCVPQLNISTVESPKYRTQHVLLIAAFTFGCKIAYQVMQFVCQHECLPYHAV